MKTKIAKGSAWPHKKPGTKKEVNLSAIQKCVDPYQPERVVLRHKYDEMFAGVREGDCFRCPDELTMAALARALRNYIKRQGWTGVVRQNAKNADGICRVWALKIFKDTVNHR